MIKDASDWTWFDKSVVVKLKELDCSGYRIIFVTNQAGIEKGKVKFLELKSKFQSIILALDVPIFLFDTQYKCHQMRNAVIKHGLSNKTILANEELAEIHSQLL